MNKATKEEVDKAQLCLQQLVVKTWLKRAYQENIARKKSTELFNHHISDLATKEGKNE